MPIDYSDYPDDWHDISKQIRIERANNRCECTGECGYDHTIFFDSKERFIDHRCIALNGKLHPISGSKVVLTVAHLGIAKPYGIPGDKHDKHDVRPDNLKAMCQLCHLSFDFNDHIRKRQLSQLQHQLDSGQLSLFNSGKHHDIS